MIVIVLAFLCQGALAQRNTVSGTVIDASDGRKIVGASISAEGMGVKVVTNADGYFTLKTDSMPDFIVVSHLGYRSQHVSLNRTGSRSLTIHMQPITHIVNHHTY